MVEEASPSTPDKLITLEEDYAHLDSLRLLFEVWMEVSVALCQILKLAGDLHSGDNEAGKRKGKQKCVFPDRRAYLV